MKFLYYFLLTLASISVQADTDVSPSKHDFAYGIKLAVENDQALQLLALPEHTYKNLASTTQGDLRIYDAQGQSMPMAIIKKAETKDIKHTVNLSFFPVHGDSLEDLKKLSISLSDSKQDININMVDTKAHKDVIAYIIDSQNPNMHHHNDSVLTELVFDWSRPTSGFIHNVQLEMSDNLSDWQVLLSSDKLSRLEHQGYQIGKNTLRIDGKTKRYLRLTWKLNDTPFTLEKIDALFSERQLDIRPESKTISIQPTKTNTKDKTHVEYGGHYITLPTKLPITQISLETSLKNYYFSAKLYGRDSGDENWQYVNTLKQYALTIGTERLEQIGMNVNGYSFNEWLLHFDQAQGNTAFSVPSLTVTWQPEFLVFLAQGQTPYTLAYGNPQVGKNTNPLTHVIDTLSKEQWQALYQDRLTPTTPELLGGIEKLTPIKDTRIVWKTILLWAVLLIAVAIMGWMAYSLLKNMKKET